MFTEQINTIADEIYPTLVEIRRAIHQNPELAFEEFETAKLVTSYLDKWGIEYESGISKTGIVAIIRGAKEGKTVALRADMDALPITENGTYDYHSKNSGKMHACGHDAHTAALLGSVYILNSLKQHISGNVKFIFQPAEEGVGGAKPMIDSGCLENPHVDAVVAGHVMSHFPVGSLMVKHGAIMASPDEFEIIIHGNGGHGAYPHRCIDPIVIAAQVVCALQSIVSRNINPLEPCVITVGYLHAGTATNIIPDTAIITGTARTLSTSVRDTIAMMIEQVAGGVITGMGGNYDYSFSYLYPPTINDDKVTDEFAASAGKIIGKENIIWGTEPSMGGEDFSFFLQERPGTFFHIGCGNSEKGFIHPIHSSQFNLDEECIKITAKCFSQFAIDFLTK